LPDSLDQTESINLMNRTYLSKPEAYEKPEILDILPVSVLSGQQEENQSVEGNGNDDDEYDDLNDD